MAATRILAAAIRVTLAIPCAAIAAVVTAAVALSTSPSISNDGRYVIFRSRATNLDADDTNIVADIFVRDRMLGTTRRVSVAGDGSEGNAIAMQSTISGDGVVLVFASLSSNLVDEDLNTSIDVFAVEQKIRPQ